MKIIANIVNAFMISLSLALTDDKYTSGMLESVSQKSIHAANISYGMVKYIFDIND